MRLVKIAKSRRDDERRIKSNLHAVGMASGAVGAAAGGYGAIHHGRAWDKAGKVQNYLAEAQPNAAHLRAGEKIYPGYTREYMRGWNSTMGSAMGDVSRTKRSQGRYALLSGGIGAVGAGVAYGNYRKRRKLNRE
jgi:hypothetical protein